MSDQPKPDPAAPADPRASPWAPPAAQDPAPADAAPAEDAGVWLEVFAFASTADAALGIERLRALGIPSRISREDVGANLTGMYSGFALIHLLVREEDYAAARMGLDLPIEPVGTDEDAPSHDASDADADTSAAPSDPPQPALATCPACGHPGVTEHADSMNWLARMLLIPCKLLFLFFLSQCSAAHRVGQAAPLVAGLVVLGAAMIGLTYWALFTKPSAVRVCRHCFWRETLRPG